MGNEYLFQKQTDTECNVCSLQNDLALPNIYTQEVRCWIKSILMFPKKNAALSTIIDHSSTQLNYDL